MNCEHVYSDEIVHYGRSSFMIEIMLNILTIKRAPEFCSLESYETRISP